LIFQVFHVFDEFFLLFEKGIKLPISLLRYFNNIILIDFFNFMGNFLIILLFFRLFFLFNEASDQRDGKERTNPHETIENC
tara:strand:- start:747 stop:989 length:243 start_codon:yes stop_codon:yes gene_type:complete